MRALWSVVNEWNIKSSSKNALFIVLLTVSCAVIGGMVWVLLGRLLLPELIWLVCFAGYPAVFVGFIGGVFYLYNHQFENSETE